ncbi:MAG: carbon monoxide dehydrogenase subunit G [Betaproteobacteria bacterium AqS2]|uniref:Carbon monoxide dehydrogenase subunit G n=1 Tax=Candidatus Amphirhobacter heronislandensis TaxID=1732024 RepID=A0A930UB17_9GAMM|nr:carbon monoxide dehydrogenase subunit G [Betaproteobacteria bacterium AqS2]
MQINDEQLIDAPREKVYAALNDPAILKKAIPGCQELDKKSDTEMTATVVLKIGPVKAAFDGEVQLSDLRPPSSYTITGKGSSGASGHASGTAKVTLEERDDGGTLLRYEVTAKLGGQLAQLGARMLQGTAKKLARKFFAALSEELGGAPAPATKADRKAEKKKAKEKPIATVEWVIGGLLVAAVLAAIIYSNV